MDTRAQIQAIEKIVNGFLEDKTGYFLVEVKIKAINNVKVFMDGDEGISIEKCVQFNRQLYKLIEGENIYPPGSFSLEVSSPGVDKPFLMLRQYKKNTGRKIEIVFNDGSIKTGRLLQVTNDDIVVEETKGKGKKAETTQLVIPFSNIKTTTVQIEF